MRDVNSLDSSRSWILSLWRDRDHQKVTCFCRESQRASLPDKELCEVYFITLRKCNQSRSNWIASRSPSHFEKMSKMEEEDDDLYEPGDSVPATNQNSSNNQAPPSNTGAHEDEDMEYVEEEEEEDDEVRCPRFFGPQWRITLTARNIG